MIIYDIFFFFFSLAYLPYLVIKGKAHRDFWQRFGRLPSIFNGIASSRPIWIHAVSVGEVLGVKNFIEKLSLKYPGKKIIVSTTTKTGNEMARKILNANVLKFYFPVDFSFVVKHVINIINPSAVLIMETEIWPNLILELSKKEIPIALINGRISDRSFKGYNKIKFLFRKILEKISLFCMRSEKDAENIKNLGAPEESVKVTGNMKFDIGTDTDLGGLGTQTSEVCKRLELEIGPSGDLLIAGSTHRGEEEILLDVYEKLIEEFKNLKLLIAPRHIDRSPAIKRLVERKGFEAILLSNTPRRCGHPHLRGVKGQVFILDTLGELSKLYSLATIVFMGGSIIKRGGHNIVEPAVFGKPIVFGPHMFNFKDMARSFLDGKAAIEVKGRKELLESLEALLKDKEKRDALGRNAKELIEKGKGATSRNIREVEKFIS